MADLYSYECDESLGYGINFQFEGKFLEALEAETYYIIPLSFTSFNLNDTQSVLVGPAEFHMVIGAFSTYPESPSAIGEYPENLISGYHEFTFTSDMTSSDIKDIVESDSITIDKGDLARTYYLGVAFDVEHTRSGGSGGTVGIISKDSDNEYMTVTVPAKSQSDPDADSKYLNKEGLQLFINLIDARLNKDTYFTNDLSEIISRTYPEYATITDGSFAKSGDIAQLSLTWTLNTNVNVDNLGKISGDSFYIGGLAADKCPIIAVSGYPSNYDSPNYQIISDSIRVTGFQGTGSSRVIPVGSEFELSATYIINTREHEE